MSALFCLFLYFRPYSEKLELYIPTFYKIRYILEELYVAVMWIIIRLMIYIDQLNTAKNKTFDWDISTSGNGAFLFLFNIRLVYFVLGIDFVTSEGLFSSMSRVNSLLTKFGFVLAITKGKIL